MQVTREDQYTYDEAASVLHISIPTLNRAIARGVFHPLKFKGDVRKYLLKSEVDALIGQSLTKVAVTKLPPDDNIFIAEMLKRLDNPATQRTLAEALIDAISKGVRQLSPLA